MLRTPVVIALLAAVSATPAPEVPEDLSAMRLLPCAIGPQANIGHLPAEGVVARLNEADENDIRYEYRLVLHNPYAWPAEVVPVLDLPGVQEAPLALHTIPAHATAQLLLGWVPVSAPLRRGAPPTLEEVARSLVLEVCHVDAPGGARTAQL
jgi:hypothetical protein